MNLGGIIGGALSGAGNATAGIAEGMIRNERQVELQQEMDKILEQREIRVAEMRERMRREGSEYDFNKDVERAPIRNKMKVDELETTEPVRQRIQREGKKAERVDELGFKIDNKTELEGVERGMTQARDLNGDVRKAQVEDYSARAEDRRETAEARRKLNGLYDKLETAESEGRTGDAKKLTQQIELHQRRHGIRERNEWTISKDADGNMVRTNQRTGDMYKVDVNNLPTQPGGEGVRPEIRFDASGKAFTKGADGMAVRASQYDKK